MASKVNIIFCLDGTNIKADVVKKIKEGRDGLKNIRTYNLGERFNANSKRDNRDVNILIITPSMSDEVKKYEDRDFSDIFPNTKKSLFLVCDSNSEKKIQEIISKSVNYPKIYQFCNSDGRKWRHSLAPTIKEMASQEKDETGVPCINRYLIQPTSVDLCCAEVSLIFFEDPGQIKPVRVTIDDKVLATTQLSSEVHVFSPQELSPGVHKVNVKVGDKDYGSTNLEIQSDINKLKTMVQRTLEKDPLTLLSELFKLDTCDKEEAERELLDLLEPFNPNFLKLLESLLQLDIGGKQDKDRTSVIYPSLLYFCAANGMSRACEWILCHDMEHKLRWENRDGLTPSQLAEKANDMALKEKLDPDKSREPPVPPVPSGNLPVYFDSDSDDLRVSMPTNSGGSDSGISTNSSASGSGGVIPFAYVRRDGPYDYIDGSGIP